MSFGDLAAQRNVRYNEGGVSKDPISLLSDSLQTFQRSCVTVKERITDMRRRKVGPAEKNDLDIQIKEIRELEGKLKNQLDFQISQLENMPRTEAASKRTTLGKLLKDFERIKVNVQSISSESALIKITREAGGEPEKFSRVGNTNNNSTGGRGNNSNGNNSANYNDGYVYSNQSNNPPPPPQFQQISNLHQLKPVMSGREVDDAIMEEREKDILKMNQDLALVNEMFKDMANLVEKQGEDIKEIGDATESSHERAKAGLDQVNQAASHQTTCVIS